MKLFKIQYLLLWASCFIMFSCSNNDDEIEENKLKDKYLWVTDETGKTEYEACLVNEADQYLAFFKTNEKGNVVSIDYYKDAKSLATVSFNQSGYVESISRDSLTIVFSNYKDKKVDVTFVYKNEIATLNNCEVPNENKVEVKSRAWYDVVEKFTEPLYDVSDKYGLAFSYAKVHGVLTKAGISGVGETEILKELIKWEKDFAWDLGIEITKNSLDYEVNHVDIVDLSFDIWAITASFGNPVAMVLNFSSYVNFFEAIFFWSMYNKELVSGALLRIAINSYESTLPPIHNEGNVTFSMGTNVTYTRIGQDVKEWGVALFKGNELIKKYPVENIAEATQNIYFTFEIPKTQFNLDYDNYVAKPKDNWYLKAYEINNQNPNISVFGRSQIDLELVYNQTPGVTFYDLEVGETIDINEDNYTKRTYYGFKYIITGTLFMEECYDYYDGSWTTPGKGYNNLLWDGRYQSADDTRVDYSPISPDVNFYIVALVNGKQIQSTNYLHFHVNEGIVEISLIDGTPDSSSRSIGRDSKSYGFVGNTSFVRVE